MFFGANMAARRARRPVTGSGSPIGRPQTRTIALVTAAAAGTGLVTLGGIAWATPERVGARQPIEVEQRAGITYAAQAPRGAAYPTGRIRTGDPVFLRLVPTMDVRIAYQATLARAADTHLSLERLSGTRRVTAELRSANGWHRGFELVPRTAFTGGSFATVAPLDLKQVRALVTRVERTTGIDDAAYTVSIRSEIALAGTISGSTSGSGRSADTPVRASFFPELTFAYDGKQVQLVEAADAATEVVRSKITAVLVPGTAANHLDLLGQELPIGPTRTGGLAAGLAILVAVSIVRLARPTPTRRRPPDRIIRRTVQSDVGSSSRSTRSRAAQSRPTPARSALARSVPFRSAAARSAPFQPTPNRLEPFRPTPARPTPARSAPTRSRVPIPRRN